MVAHLRDGAAGRVPTAKYEELTFLALIVIFTYVAVVPVTVLMLLVRARRAIQQRRRSLLANALRSLHEPYRPEAFYYELVEASRKTFLVGFAVFIKPGSLLQLIITIAVAVGTLVLLLVIMPHRDQTNGFLCMATSLSTTFVLLSAVVLRTSQLADELGEDGRLARRFTFLDYEFDVVVISLLASCALTVVALAAVTAYNVLRVQRELPYVRLKVSGALVRPAPRSPNEDWHVFVSNVWATGQDQARAVKELLKEVLVGVRVFLDIDDLDKGRGAEYVMRSSALLVFASKGYFLSINCLRELTAAIYGDKRLVLVYETDADKGGFSHAELRTEIEDAQIKPVELFDANSAALFGKAAGARSKKANAHPVEPSLQMPTVEAMREATELALPSAVPWYRTRGLKEETLLEIVRHLVPPPRAEQYLLPGAVNHGRKMRLAWLPADVPHLYVSKHNPGVTDVVVAELKELAVERSGRPCARKEGPMRVLDQLPDPVAFRRSKYKVGRCCAAQRSSSTAFLLYLDRRTWTGNLERRRELARDVARAMACGMHIVLAHEMSTTPGLYAEEFKTFFEHTPRALVGWGVYGSTAIPLKTAPGFRSVGLHCLAAAVANALWAGPIEFAAPEGVDMNLLDEVESVDAELEVEDPEDIADSDALTSQELLAQLLLDDRVLPEIEGEGSELFVNHELKKYLAETAKSQAAMAPSAGESHLQSEGGRERAAGSMAPSRRAGTWKRLNLDIGRKKGGSEQLEQLTKFQTILQQQYGVHMAQASQHTTQRDKLLVRQLRKARAVAEGTHLSEGYEEGGDGSNWSAGSEDELSLHI